MEVKACFLTALKDEGKGRKHKGLLIKAPDEKMAGEYITKVKRNLELCDFYKEKGFDYKIPEEWFYTLYYCALAITLPPNSRIIPINRGRSFLAFQQSPFPLS